VESQFFGQLGLACQERAGGQMNKEGLRANSEK